MTPLTPAGEVLASEIRRSGPIHFRRFMEVALYHPECGYYRSRKDPFGKAGDFFTAEQLQPVFGRLVSRYLQTLANDLGGPGPVTIVELGAGRGEMAGALQAFNYIPVDIDYGNIPRRFTGIVFSNEFFDAIPVDVIAARAGGAIEQLVTFDGERFQWIDGPPVAAELEEGTVREVQSERLRWLEQINDRLERGFIVTIDYGFTRRELIRFPQGTLMSYRSHRAHDDVLAEPGTRDITAHVAFTDLQEHGEQLGWTNITFESLASIIMRAGEADEFRAVLAGDTDAETLKHRMQLKSLLFGMGETFRVLAQRKGR